MARGGFVIYLQEFVYDTGCFSPTSAYKDDTNQNAHFVFGLKTKTIRMKLFLRLLDVCSLIPIGYKTGLKGPTVHLKKNFTQWS